MGFIYGTTNGSGTYGKTWISTGVNNEASMRRARARARNEIATKAGLIFEALRLEIINYFQSD